MKAMGIIREVDGLGRIVIPKELRREYGLNKGTPLEILVNGREIIFRLHVKSCVFCGRQENLIKEDETYLCNECLNKLIIKRKVEENETN